MITRDDALSYAMTFSNVYIDVPFRDTNWQLARVKRNLTDLKKQAAKINPFSAMMK